MQNLPFLLHHILILQKLEQSHEDIAILIHIGAMSSPTIIIFRKESSIFFNEASSCSRFYFTGKTIQDKNVYNATMARIEELLPLVDDNTPKTDKNLIELDLLSELASEYEDEHYPIKTKI